MTNSAEQFLANEENKTGLARTSRWTWESACQFAEAYARSVRAEERERAIKIMMDEINNDPHYGSWMICLRDVIAAAIRQSGEEKL